MDAMDRIEGQLKDQEELAKQALSWITCARRPLTTLELQHALAVEVAEFKLDEDNLPEIEDIVSVCAGLVTVDEESNIIRLVHYTTQEYFQRTQKHWFPNAETRITETCVTYLSFNEFESGMCQNDKDFEQRLHFNKLYDYAAHNWGYHTQEALTATQVVLEFLQKQGQVEASSQALMAVKEWPAYTKYSQEIPRQITGLHLAAYFGVIEVVQFLLSSNSPHLKDSYDRTPLSYAAAGGHDGVVQLLLTTRGVDADSKNDHGRTPLSWAAANGHDGVVQLLLATQGVDADSKDNYGQTPLSWAARNGHKGVIQLLLAAEGIDADSKDDYGRTPLSWAAENGYCGVVQLLLATLGVDADSKSRVRRTPLLYASKNGNEVIVQLLLATNRVDIDSKDYYNSTPLSIAARRGHRLVLELLLSQSQSLNIKDNFGRSPLWWARKTKHLSIANLLLEKYKQKGIVLHQDDLPTATTSLFAKKTYRLCDVCLLDVLETDAYYHCETCNNGDFDICEECFGEKAHCLDKAHMLIKV
jgi:ankyrin repeat protein